MDSKERAYTIRRVQYYYTTVKDVPGASYRLLSTLAELGVGMLAFTAVPAGLMQTQLTIFPEQPGHLEIEARKAQLELEGPHPALFVQGDTGLGALAPIHRKLLDAEVNVFASTATSDGRGGYGYLIYIRPEQFDAAVEALGI